MKKRMFITTDIADFSALACSAPLYIIDRQLSNKQLHPLFRGQQ